MVQLKRKPVYLTPLPSLSTILTPIPPSTLPTPSAPIIHPPAPTQYPTGLPPPTLKLNAYPIPPPPYTSHPAPTVPAPSTLAAVPPYSYPYPQPPHHLSTGPSQSQHPLATSTTTDVVVGDITTTTPKGRGKKGVNPAQAGGLQTVTPSTPTIELEYPQDGKDDDEQLDKLQAALRGDLHSLFPVEGGGDGDVKEEVGVYGSGNGNGNGVGGGKGHPSYKIKNVDCFYIPETGEVFMDYESYAARHAFYQQNIFQCEATGKSNLSYYTASRSEIKEARQLHTRFPKQLKKAVLSAVQFQIEGKLENLADKVYERFVNRFFDDEKVFVDVQGDKYLARIVKTFLPRALQPPSSPVQPQTNGHNPNSHLPEPLFHPYATDLSLSTEEVKQRDDPMKYFYNVRLIEEGNDRWDQAAAVEGGGVAVDGGGLSGEVNGNPSGVPQGLAGDDGTGERWGSSTMEVQADKISRDRINFSRALLKRFIRDCVTRDPAVYSPWLLKPSIAHRYSIPTEMPEHIRLGHIAYRERQMDKRKREREERLGIGNGSGSGAGGSEIDEEEARRKKGKVEEEVVEVESKRRKPLKYPAEDLLVDFSIDRDPAAGRIEVRPSPEKSLPFQDKFESFLMAWSFLNVMGKQLGLSPFTLDDFEQSLYHNDAYTLTSTLLTEIHATLLNALMFDIGAQDSSKLPQLTAISTDMPDSGADLWEGKKGTNVDILRPLAEPLALSWYTKELLHKDSRRGWESTLVGCMWAKGNMETLPNYLDNILHLLFEDKPAPTRPTWSTGPASTGGVAGLIPSKPEKRYGSLHFTHKLDIVVWLVDQVVQTARIRDFMEDSVAALTEVRKDQVEVKREWKRVRAEREALEPREKPTADADGDVSMDGVKVELGTPEPSLNGGTKSNTERDELDSVDGGSIHLNGNRRNGDQDSEHGFSRSSSPASDDELQPSGGGPSHQASNSAAERRKAMAAKAAERSQAETERLAKVKVERAEARAKKAENKNLSAEKKRLQDEEDVLSSRLKQLDYEFRSHIYTLRSKTLGTDRFGNKIWWMDGLGSNTLSDHAAWGTGRLYVQGVDETDLTWNRLLGIAAATANAGGNRNIVVDITEEEVEERRKAEEGDGRLAPGQWGMYDTPEQLATFVSWLNPKGIRELQLLKQINAWYPELEAGMKNRRKAAGLEPTETTTTDEPRRRLTRKAAGGEDEKDGFLSWKNRLA